MMKQTSSRVSSLAAKVLKGHKPNEAEIMIMAASLLSQDETPPGTAARTKEVEPNDRMDDDGAPSPELTSDFYHDKDLTEAGGLFGEKN